MKIFLIMLFCIMSFNVWAEDVTYTDVPEEAVKYVNDKMTNIMIQWFDKGLLPPANDEAVKLQKENWLKANGLYKDLDIGP